MKITIELDLMEATIFLAALRQLKARGYISNPAYQVVEGVESQLRYELSTPAARKVAAELVDAVREVL